MIKHITEETEDIRVLKWKMEVDVNGDVVLSFTEQGKFWYALHITKEGYIKKIPNIPAFIGLKVDKEGQIMEEPPCL